MQFVARGGAGHVPMRWVALFVSARILATAVAILLLTIHFVTPHDDLLIAGGAIYGMTTVVLAITVPTLLEKPAMWLLDALAVLGLVLASDDWRSPFYLLMLTSLGPPSATLAPRIAMAWGLAFTAGYAVVAVLTDLPSSNFQSTWRLETVTTHMLLPLVATGGVAYTADALRRLAVQRARAERLAVETERRRIAWELHDSAKQRLHAGTLMLSALFSRVGEGDRELLSGALEQLRGATADMETSIAELRSPLDGHGLGDALRRRAAELATISRAAIDVSGEAPPLDTVPATHVYRIVSEAMSNAARHAEASAVEVQLRTADHTLYATVDDDGRGMPKEVRPGANGLLTMRSRAFAIGARLRIGERPDGNGTRVELELPLESEGATT